MFNRFNRDGAKQITNEMLEELEALGLRHGLKFSAAGGKLGVNDMTIHIKAETTNELAIEDEAKAALDRNGAMFGVDASHYGVKFRQGHKTYKFIGVKPSRPKYPVQAVCELTGNQYKFTPSVLGQIRG